jgi:methyl-accepting chemotaxis protein
MEAKPQTMAAPQGGKPKRRLRNFLLDARFQLKYTSMVVAVTLAVASILGYFAYGFSTDVTQAMNLEKVMDADGADAAVIASIEREAEEQDRKVLLSIIAGIAFLGLSLGFTGIVVTHKVVGPAYKLRLLLNEVAEGKLKLAGRLRKGDELQELFEGFALMVESLRTAQAREVAQLDDAIAQARAAGISEEGLRTIVEVRDRMQAALD